MIQRKEFVAFAVIKIILMMIVIVMVFSLMQARSQSDTLLRAALDKKHEQVLESFERTEKFLQRVEAKLNEIHGNEGALQK